MIEEVSDKSKAAEAFRESRQLADRPIRAEGERKSILSPILARLRLTKTRV